MKSTTVAVWIFLLGGGTVGCVAPGEGNRYERHFRSDFWSQAIAEEVSRPEQWVPAAALAVATPVIFFYDQEIQDSTNKGFSLTNGNEDTANKATFGLGALALGFGAYKWADGDRGEAMEVAAETILFTEVTAGLLKVATSRTRPNKKSGESFPSGHTAFAFSTATLLAREIESREDSSWGYLFYVPAVYIGISRVESDRHFTSDVTFGALMGIVIANTVFNLHYGDERKKTPGLYEHPPKPSAWRVEPLVGDNTVGISLRFSF